MSTLCAATSGSSPLYRQERAPAVVSPTVSQADARGTVGQFTGHFGVIAFLFAIAWLAHFSRSHGFGFYSDDHTFAVHALNWSPADFKLWLTTQAVSYPEPQGRPLGFILGQALPYFANRVAGVDGMFVVGWWILSLNAVLFYYLMRRCFCQPLPLLGAISFLLFPADTTRPFLCHLHILQPSLTFMLIAGHLYLGGNLARRICAYFMILPCLLTYETALLPFLAIPLLEPLYDRRWLRRFIIHVATVFLIIAFVGLTRQLGGEYRTMEATGSKAAVIFDIFAGSFIGPAVAMAACFWRIVTTVIHLRGTPSDILILVTTVAVFAMLLTLGRLWTGPSRLAHDVKRSALFGAGAIFVSYILSFTHFPPLFLNGQITSVHLAAAVGGSALMASAGGALFLFKPRQWKVIATAIIAIYLGLMFVNAWAEQDGYVAIWQERQQFWTRVLDLCPDLSDRTLIICDGQLPQPSKVMPGNSWSDTEVLAQVYQFPVNFTLNPELICFAPDASGDGWRTYVTRNSMGRVIWNKFVVGVRDGGELVEGNTILLHIDRLGHVTRAQGAVEIDGKPFGLKKSSVRDKLKYPVLPFYKVLIEAGR